MMLFLFYIDFFLQLCDSTCICANLCIFYWSSKVTLKSSIATFFIVATTFVAGNYFILKGLWEDLERNRVNHIHHNGEERGESKLISLDWYLFPTNENSNTRRATSMPEIHWRPNLKKSTHLSCLSFPCREESK